MSDKPTTRAATYAWMIHDIQALARQYGYAVGVHGSMHRDLDLMAVAWVEDAKPAEVLIEAIREMVDGHIVPDGTTGGRWNSETKQYDPVTIRQPEEKPHGRLAWNIHVSENRFVIDISVMGPKKE